MLIDPMPDLIDSRWIHNPRGKRATTQCLSLWTKVKPHRADLHNQLPYLIFGFATRLHFGLTRESTQIDYGFFINSFTRANILGPAYHSHLHQKIYL